MLSIYLKAVGLLAPGMPSWDAARSILQRPDAYVQTPIKRQLASILPPNENRRTAKVTQMALYAAQQIAAQYPTAACQHIFACCNGDMTTFDQISRSLAQPNRPVSPTRFHNSVHNAAAGYWSIATHSQAPSTSISAGEDSFAVGLLEAVVQALAEQQDSLLVAYDEPTTLPMSAWSAITQPFACALLFSSQPDEALAHCTLAFDSAKKPSTLAQAALENLRLSNPQAKALPLLCALVQSVPQSVVLAHFDRRLCIQVQPMASI